MNYLTKQIVLQEIPDEISLSYLITGCELLCKDCHSADSWNSKLGSPLTSSQFLSDLKKYQDWISCVLFMGGEWQHDELCELLDIAKSFKLKTALYTGQETVCTSLLNKLEISWWIKFTKHKSEVS